MVSNWSKWLDKFSLGDRKPEELPDRSHELLLDLPLLKPLNKSKFKKKELEPRIEFWKGLEPHPVELLRDIDRYLKRINSIPVSESRRSVWVDQSLQYACPAIRRIYSDQYKLEALPETHDRREGIVASINVCNQLAMGFKRQLLDDYTSSDSHYSKIRKRVGLNALRILELIRMEQRLRSMRYQKLPGTVWRDCNRIFFAVSQCEDVNEVHPILSCMQPQLDSKARELGRIQPKTTSILNVYLTIQLYGLMDTNSVSSQNMHIIDAYLARVVDKLEIKADDGSPLPSGEVIIYSNQKAPAYFKRLSEDSLTTGSVKNEKILTARIDLIPLEMLLVNEQKRLFSLFGEDKEGKGKAVTSKIDIERLSIVEIMCNRLRLKQRSEERENIFGQEALFVYNGFMQVYKYLVEITIQEDDDIHDGPAVDNVLRDALASRSALIASRMDLGDCGKWYVLDKSEGGVHIKTQESQFTVSMFVGQLLAFGFSQEELNTPKLGYVARLNRSSAGEIEVTIQILSSSPVATAIQSEFLSKNDMAFPAILLEEDVSAASSQIVLHHSHRLSPGTNVQVELEGKQIERTISGLKLLQREFVVYGLDVVKKP